MNSAIIASLVSASSLFLHGRRRSHTTNLFGAKKRTRSQKFAQPTRLQTLIASGNKERDLIRQQLHVELRAFETKNYREVLRR